MKEKENLNKEKEQKQKKKGFVAWWGGLTNPIKGLIIGGTTVALASAIVFPTLAATIWKKPNQPKEWYEDETYINSLGEDDVGKTEKEILVNGQKHKVRLIGINHDFDDKGNKIHTTWEFANLISDENGYSLAYQWNDTNNTSSANYDYINSTIRYALTGSGNNNGHGSTILAGVKGNTNWESSYKNKTIYSMLPSAFANKIKTVKKSVGVKTTSDYTETEYSDKLFMPSTIELGYSSKYDKGFGSAYSYYKNATSQADDSRIKKQVNGSTVCTDYASISSGSGHAYSGAAYNCAGYNYKNGGYYWLRSPYSGSSYTAWICNFDGSVYGSGGVCDSARGVAPAFCL